MKTSDLTRVALMLALLIVSAQFSIPLGPVAISLQSSIVLIIGLVLPKKQAIITTSLYLIAGLIGLPVFSQAMGGPHSVFLPSFGFILSFIPAVWLMAEIREMNTKDKLINYVQAILVGNIVIYLIGIAYMFFILIFYMGNEMTFWRILSIGMLTFIPGDIIKSIVAVSIARKLNQHFIFYSYF